jgi:hypothetical protein
MEKDKGPIKLWTRSLSLIFLHGWLAALEKVKAKEETKQSGGNTN